jgi:23S rRNA (uridine2552-2'-O)-methyltransferase
VAPARAPGGVVAAATPAGPRPLVVAVDLIPMEPLSGAAVLQGDFFAGGTQEALWAALAPSAGRPRRGPGAVDAVLSDMAHSFTGEPGTDHTRQMALSWAALLFAAGALRPGGVLVVKVRYGEGYGPFRAAVARRFAACHEVKPPASRADSAEAYIIGKGFLHIAPRDAGQEEGAVAAAPPNTRQGILAAGPPLAMSPRKLGFLPDEINAMLAHGAISAGL